MLGEPFPSYALWARRSGAIVLLMCGAIANAALWTRTCACSIPTQLKLERIDAIGVTPLSVEAAP